MNQSEAGKLGYLASIEGRAKTKLKREESYNLNPRKCLYCDKALPYKKDYIIASALVSARRY